MNQMYVPRRRLGGDCGDRRQVRGGHKEEFSYSAMLGLGRRFRDGRKGEKIGGFVAQVRSRAKVPLRSLLL